MKDYLKMATCFSGSVTIDYNGNLCDDKSFFGSTDIAEDYYAPICHAINSHDELVAMSNDLLATLRNVLCDCEFEIRHGGQVCIDTYSVRRAIEMANGGAV